MAQLDPRVVQAIVGLVSNPAFVVEVTVYMLYPEVKEKFDTWLQGHMIAPPSGGEVYDWWQKEFPMAPIRNDQMDPNECFRNLFKAIVAKAFNLPNPNTPKLDLTQVNRVI